MKKKIYQLAREEFEDTTAALVLQEERIKRETQEDKSIKGTLFIRNSDNRRMKGVLYATAPFIHLQETSFSGTEALIDYELFPMERKAGELLFGEIYLVTSCGEYRIGVELLIKEDAEKKKAGNLFRLANLAQSDWEAAVEQYKRLYGKKSTGPASQELEEQLIDGNKKWKVEIGTDSRNFYYEPVTESFAESLVLKKNTWGYLKINVWSDADFLQPEHKVIWSDNFIGNNYILEFLVCKEKLHAGKNYGRLYIATVHQTLCVEVCAVREGSREEKLRRRKQKEAFLLLVNNYQKYRCGLMDKEAYAKDGLAWEKEAKEFLPEKISQFLEIYFLVLSGETALAEEFLKDIALEKAEDRAALAYLSCLCQRNEEENREFIKKEYQKKPDKGWLLWFWLQTDKEFFKEPEKRFQAIEEYNSRHLPGTVFYIELLEALNEQPSLLKELTPSVTGALNWGVRFNLLSQRVKERYIFLAAKEENTSHALKGLKALYSQEPSEEVLYAIVSIMVKNNCIGDAYFPWYKKGVLKQLRVNGLYEAYLCSLREEKGMEIPKQVLTYFAYDSILPDEAKELLYAYIIKHKEKDMETYLEFSGLIEQFALKRLSDKALNPSLAVIYPEILVKGKLEEFYLKRLSALLFRQRLICENPNITGVYVRHKELLEEEYVPLEKGKADIYLFTENPEISFCDAGGSRYGKSVEYRLERYLDLSDWLTECYQANPENVRLLLNLYEKIEKYQYFDENANEIRRKVLEVKGLRTEYQTECRLALIHQYFDKMEEEALKEQLLAFTPGVIKEKERAKLIDYCILQGLYERAYELIGIWGYDEVPKNRLLRLACRLLETVSGKEEVLLSLCNELLQWGRYNQATLAYLALYYEGLLGQMCFVWEKAQECRVETSLLEERILSQLLFDEGYTGESIRIFASYYRKRKNLTLIRAYLNFYSYRYFVKGVSLPEAFFTFLSKELKKEYVRIQSLAYLQWASEKKELLPEEKRQTEECLGYFLKQNEIFPFFKKFKDILSLEEGVLNRTFIEYRTLPGQRVSLSYRMSEMEDFKTIPMTELGYGIYSADFLLFQDETLQYYITEQDKNQELITESSTITKEDESKELENSAFGLLEAIVAARQLKDDEALEELMEEYILQEYRKEKLFKML